MTLISLINFFIDTALTLLYFRRLDNMRRRTIFSILSFLCLFLTASLYTTGMFPFLSGSIQRFLLRAALLFLYVYLSRPVRPITALYAVIYWCTLQTLVQSLFFAPFSYPVFQGTAAFTGTYALDLALCILITLIVKAGCFALFLVFTPFAGMSPIYPIDIIPAVLVAAVDVYVREIAIPMTGMRDAGSAATSNYYIILQVVLLVLLGFIELSRTYRAQRTADQFKKQETEALLRTIQVDQENARAAAAFRHDLKNHLLSLKLLNQENRADEVDQYIDTLLDKGTPPRRQFRTGNDLADGLLSIKLDSEAVAGIDIQVHLDLTQAGFMSNEDLCVLLGNVIDNALEACAAVEDGSHRYLSVKGAVSANFLLLRFENSCQAMPTLIDGLPLTGKKDSLLHGYGLKNVRAVLENYHGTLSISQGAPHQFVLSMMIPLPEYS